MSAGDTGCGAMSKGTDNCRSLQERVLSSDDHDTFAKGGHSEDLVLVHFNDVYEITARKKEPVGGAARFAQKVKEITRSCGGVEPLTVFAGDALSPSNLSLVSKGLHMVDVLNSLQVDIALPGNHDFDLGVHSLVGAIAESKFTWILSNLWFEGTGCDTLSGKVPYHVVSRNGLTLGFIGLIEAEWLTTLHTTSDEDSNYTDFTEVGERLAAELREKHGCDAVVAVTHMRMPNDRIAAQIKGVDLVLGGHDHAYVDEVVDGTRIVKSGSDFRDLSVVRISKKEGGGITTAVERHTITSEVPEDEEMAGVVSKWAGEMEKKMELRIGGTAIDLECRFQCVRTRETNAANFIADSVREGVDAEIAILGSGTLRADSIICAGDVLHRDMVSMLPYPDGLVVVGLTGAQVVAALENGVSQHPKLDGRFPCVSGVRFAFDTTKEPGSRIVRESVVVHAKPIELEREYTVATTWFLSEGHDGYEMFKDGRVVLDIESTPTIPTLILNEFKTIEVLKQWREGSVSQCHMPKRSKSMSKYGGSRESSGSVGVEVVADAWLRRVRSGSRADVEHAQWSHAAPPSLPVEVDGTYLIHPVEDGRIEALPSTEP